MLSERTRNTIVGLTMLVGLGAFMVAVFLLNKLPDIHTVPPYTITLLAPNSNGLSSGNSVNFNGVGIGSVRNVDLGPDMHGVKITLLIDHWVDVPSNAIASIGKPLTVGNPYVAFAMPGQDPVTGKVPAPGPPLPKDGSAAPLAAQLADNGLIPKSVIDHLNAVGADLDTLLEKRSLAEFEKEDPNTRVANVSILVQRIDRVARSLDGVVGDPNTQERIKKILEDVSAATADFRSAAKKADAFITHADTTLDSARSTIDKMGSAATQASGTFETTQAEIAKTSQHLADLLASLQKTTDAIAAGQGTAGKFVNDPRLYDGLVDLTKSLKSTTDDLKVLIQRWSDEGVPLHLK